MRVVIRWIATHLKNFRGGFCRFIESGVWLPTGGIVVAALVITICIHEDRKIERERLAGPISTESLEEIRQLITKEPALKDFVKERVADYISQEEYGEIVEEYRRLLEGGLR